MTIITDELVEKAAQRYQDLYYPGGRHRDCMRAALEAIIPDIVEVCADVAWRENYGGEAAGAIRALIPDDQQPEVNSND